MNNNKKKQKKPSLFFQAQNILKQQLDLGCGTSRFKDKQLDMVEHTNNHTFQKIYSYKTFKSYLQSAKYFCNFIKSRHPNIRTLKLAEKYVPQYFRYLVQRYNDGEISASTVHSYASSVCKIYQHSLSFYGVELPERQRKNIKRSRGTAKRDKNFNEEKHQELVNFCKHTGLRRRELSLLRGSDLVFKDGLYYIHVQKGGKGGKERYAPILHQDKGVIQLMQESGCAKVFDSISSNADIHHYRGLYAMELYKSLARPIEYITNRKEIYICRKDLKGCKYDKNAMKLVSQALGHTRISVIAQHYLYS